MNDNEPLVHEVEDSHELYGWPGHGRYVLCCEHASNRLPPPIRPGPGDAPWLETHWAYDIGGGELTREVVRNTGSVAVLARFSRLIVDANRAPGHPTLIVPRVEHHPLGFNELLSPAERAQRIEQLHRPYHRAVDDMIQRRLPMGGDVALISVHTFVPALYGLQRNIDAGVLFNPYESIATRLAESLRERGLVTALNEPYSGRRGLIYSAERHGLNHQVVYLELEINQALLSTPPKIYQLGRTISESLAELGLRKASR